MSRKDLRRLAAILAQEREALLHGDIARLERLAPRKVAILERVEGALPELARADTGLARAVQQAAGRNAGLFEAAITGIKDARALMARARKGGTAKTYGRDGIRADLNPPHGSLHRRA
ncbi:hypothetical protein JI664_10140 [Rhodobacter sp. NTK016B]|uniref:hypothetical protein n=1 Tax=Rhodobacter sp. NTK016B TaxID=2759676 RepID=UPI001A8FCBA5|nr:hypothetical protein [Rhodobacter sp. NTK016B]MBN8292324.1 hypothetical protein [Rhodobacter sp. NTK016B]